MGDDFELGRKLVASIASQGGIQPQRVMALITDVIGDDVELSSSFRLLLAHPVFVQFFASSSPEIAPRLTTLLDLSRQSLAPRLSIRVEDFLRGYLSTLEPSNVFIHSSHSSPAFPVSVPANTSIQEPATVYADSVNSGREGSSVQLISPASQFSLKSSSVKQLLGVVAVFAAAIAAFRVPALCEPFGLCPGSDSNIDPPRPPSKSVKVDPAAASPVGSSSSSSVNSATVRSEHVPPRVAPSQQSPSPGGQPPVRANQPVYRDSPLW